MRKTVLCILLTAFVFCTACLPSGQPEGDAVSPASPVPAPLTTAAPVSEAETVSIQTVAPVSEAVTLPPVPTPSPTPEPTPTPTPEPTAVPERIGVIRYALTDLFSEPVVDTDDTYRDGHHCITVTRTETTERTGKSLVYFVVDIYVEHAESIMRAVGGKSFQQLSAKSMETFAAETNAVVAMSGDYCTPKDRAYVVVNGEVVFQSAKFRYDLCALFRDGTVITYAPNEIQPSFLEAKGVWQTWNFGPMLLDKDGEPMKKFNMPDHIDGPNPRAAFGYYEPGHYCFVLVDGRQNGYSVGLSLTELSLLMKDLGCTAAYNLDGGISAQLAWHAKRINHPGKNRSIVDIVYVPYPTDAPSEETDEP